MKRGWSISRCASVNTGLKRSRCPTCKTTPAPRAAFASARALAESAADVGVELVLDQLDPGLQVVMEALVLPRVHERGATKGALA